MRTNFVRCRRPQQPVRWHLHPHHRLFSLLLSRRRRRPPPPPRRRRRRSPPLVATLDCSRVMDPNQPPAPNPQKPKVSARQGSRGGVGNKTPEER